MDTSTRPYRLVLTNCPNMPLAERIALALVEGRHAACVNIVPGIQSIYRWAGKLERDNEVLLLIKTELACLAGVEQCIRTLHTYEVPEMIALPISHGYTPYLNWITESIQP
jgi:periplasmic divalent cation tolerance protein